MSSLYQADKPPEPPNDKRGRVSLFLDKWAWLVGVLLGVAIYVVWSWLWA